MADTEGPSVAQLAVRVPSGARRPADDVEIAANAVGVPVVGDPGSEAALGLPAAKPEPSTQGLAVHEARADDQELVDAFLEDRGTAIVARRGELIDARLPPALLAWSEGRVVGVLTWIADGDAFEILTLHVEHQWQGTGTALLDGARRLAASLECRRIWLITTNDNLDALRFYQRRGFRLVDIRPGAVDLARAHLKPAIPETGDTGIPIRDELELELELVTRSGLVPVARTPAPVAEALSALELALASRDEDAIPGGYAAALDDAFVEIGASGRTWGREATLQALTRARRVEGIELDDVECSMLGPDTALVLYVLRLPGPVGDDVVSRRSSVWLRREGRWRIRYHQGTPLPAAGT